jgi:hypothetical protein
MIGLSPFRSVSIARRCAAALGSLATLPATTIAYRPIAYFSSGAAAQFRVRPVIHRCGTWPEWIGAPLSPPHRFPPPG